MVWPAPVVYANEPPTDISLSNSSVAENEPISTTVGTFSTTDPDSGDSHTYSFAIGLGDDDNDSFTIVSDTLKTAETFDYETKNTYNIRVQSDDGNGGTYTKPFTITVTDVNDPPVANDDPYSVNEGDVLTVIAPAGVLANDIDADAGDTLTATLVSSPSHGALALNPDGSFTYVHEGTTSSDSFTYRAYDGTAYSNVATATITIQLFDPVMTAITVTSSSPTYFYAPGLGVTGGEVFFNSVFGEGGGQTITVTISFTDAHPYSLTGSPAFGDPPGSDISGPPWTLTYTIETGANSEPNRVFTVTDKAGLTDTAVITFTRDNVDPIVEFTDVTNPGYDSGGGELDTNGSNWYDEDDFPGGNWTFTSDTNDSGAAGLAYGSAFWDHSANQTDRTLNCGPDGDGTFLGVSSDDEGTVTVTVTITDHVGNSASNLVVFNIDNTKPTIYPGSPPIVEGSPYLYANDLTVYYGDEMGTAPHAFTVQGDAQDSGVGLDYVSYSAALGEPYHEDPDNLENWHRDYTANQYDTTSGVITATIYDRLGHFATQTFTYTRDITSPDISYGSPPIVENSPHDALYADGTTVYYSDQMGSTPQSFTVRGNAADNGGGAGLDRATFFSPHLSDPGDDLFLPYWSGIYYVDSSDSGTGLITVRVYDNVSNWSQLTFDYIEDTTAPTVNLTSVTPPGYDENTDPLDTDGSNWYNADDFTAGGGGGGWEFNSYTDDDGASLASGTAMWDHSNNDFDRLPLDCGPDGDGTFPNASGDAEGTVTVTVTIADHVGNSASDTVVFNIDNTAPTITSPTITEDSVYLYADDLTIYYGDMALATFTVNGSSDDTGVGLDHAEFSDAFGAAPSDDDTPDDWAGTYYPNNSQNWGSGTITVTVYDWLGNAAYEYFYYIRDTVSPVPDVTCPATTSVPSFLVRWNDSIDPPPDASGLNHFDVQYKMDSDDWQDWHTNTLLTQDTFGPASPVIVEDDRTYYFRVRAVDKVSNEQYTDGQDATTYHSGIKKILLPIVMAPDPNWGFELGNFTSWQHGGQLAQSVTAMPYSGSYSALLGSPSYPCNGVPIGSAWLRRSVTVPSSGSPILSFHYRIFTQDKTSPQYLEVSDLDIVPSGDRFAVTINGEQLFADANTTKPEKKTECETTLYPTPYDLEWKRGIVPLNNYQGQTIEITFHNYNWPDKWYNTYTYIDDVSVQ